MADQREDRSRVDRPQVLGTITRELLSAAPFPDIGRRVANAVISHLDLDAHLGYLAHAALDLRLESWVGIPEDVAVALQRGQSEEALSRAAATRRAATVVEDIQSS